MYLQRKVYKRLLEWKSNPDHDTLLLAGPRQVGKTYLINRFADENYKKKIYIDLTKLSGQLFSNHYQQLLDDMMAGKRYNNPVFELLRRYDNDFIDSKDTVVIIDEIQDSSKVYNMIREFTRTLECDFIVTGSYLGRTYDQSFWESAGDVTTIKMYSLDFEEFLMALKEYDLYLKMDLFGQSSNNVYDRIKSFYDIYIQIGGYPSVVLEYIRTGDVQVCMQEMRKLITVFCDGSKKYFTDILDVNAFMPALAGITRLLSKEKLGFKAGSFSEKLQKLIIKDYSSNISKAVLNRAINWFYASKIIGFAGRVPECNQLEFVPNVRCYFTDLGLTNYLLIRINASDDTKFGILNETFVYNEILFRTEDSEELAFEMPAFAILGNGEIDFLTVSVNTHKVLAICLVESSMTTAKEALAKGKVDKLLYLKGDTHGGVNGDVITIPIYGLLKFDFNSIPEDSFPLGHAAKHIQAF